MSTGALSEEHRLAAIDGERRGPTLQARERHRIGAAPRTTCGKAVFDDVKSPNRKGAPHALCPRLGTRVAKLYLPPGGKHFLARKAWRIAYRSQNASSTFDRLCISRDRLLTRKLNSRDPDFPLKPKWMRRRTYEAHLDRLDHLHTRMDLEMMRRFAPEVLARIL
jgi:hypothetical protein